jgi:hypothetical protein
LIQVIWEQIENPDPQSSDLLPSFDRLGVRLFENVSEKKPRDEINQLVYRTANELTNQYLLIRPIDVSPNLAGINFLTFKKRYQSASSPQRERVIIGAVALQEVVTLRREIAMRLLEDFSKKLTWDRHENFLDSQEGGIDAIRGLFKTRGNSEAIINEYASRYGEHVFSSHDFKSLTDDVNDIIKTSEKRINAGIIYNFGEIPTTYRKGPDQKFTPLVEFNERFAVDDKSRDRLLARQVSDAAGVLLDTTDLALIVGGLVSAPATGGLSLIVSAVGLAWTAYDNYVSVRDVNARDSSILRMQLGTMDTLTRSLLGHGFLTNDGLGLEIKSQDQRTQDAIWLRYSASLRTSIFVN